MNSFLFPLTIIFILITIFLIIYWISYDLIHIELDSLIHIELESSF